MDRSKNSLRQIARAGWSAELHSHSRLSSSATAERSHVSLEGVRLGARGDRRLRRAVSLQLPMRPLRGRRNAVGGSAGHPRARCTRPRATHGYFIDRSAVAHSATANAFASSTAQIIGLIRREKKGRELRRYTRSAKVFACRTLHVRGTLTCTRNSSPGRRPRRSSNRCGPGLASAGAEKRHPYSRLEFTGGGLRK